MHPFFKKLRFVFRFTVSLTRKYYLALFLGVALGMVSFFTFPSLVSRLPKIRPTQSIAVVGRHIQSEIPLAIQNQISIGLTSLTPSGLAAPAIAQSWTVSEDGKIYTFKLRSDLFWHDGTPLVSGDINYHFKDAQVEFPSSSTLVIRLPQAFSPLTSTALTRPLFKPVKPSLLSTFFSRFLAWPDFVGLGSYRIANVSKNGQFLQSLTLVPTDQKSHLPNLKYIFYPTQDQAQTAFKLGLVRTILDLPQPSPLGSWPSVRQLPQTLTDRFVGIFFNTQDPQFSDTSGRNLRLALAYAIDKTRFSHRALGPLDPTSWAYNPDIKPYEQDFQKAKAFLAKVATPPQKLTLTTTPSYLNLAADIKRDWETLGLATEIVPTSDITANFSLLLFAQSIPKDPDQYHLWHSAGSSNITKLNNPRIDKLLEDGRRLLDLDQRKAVLFAFQKSLVDDSPVIFLYYPQTYILTRD